MAINGFDTQISWTGFTKVASRPSGSDGDAYTYAVFSSNNIQPTRGEGKSIVVKSADISIVLNKSQSWSVDSKQSDELLKHEQGHYDITTLGAREVYNSLFKLKEKNVKSLGDSIQALTNRVQKKIDDANKRYDEQTDHSRKRSEQEKWNKAITIEKQKADGTLDNLP